MRNHFHLLISTPREDLGTVMMHFMRSATRMINEASGRSGHVFGGRYHWTIIGSDLYFAHAYKYLYRNPVRAGICERVEEYPYSTLSGLLGNSPLRLPVHFPFELESFLRIPENYGDQLIWLNRPFKIEHQEKIQKALQRTEFEPSKSGWKRRLQELNEELL